MKLFRKGVIYLAIGVCLGIGIVLVDELYFRYGNPKSVEVAEEWKNNFTEAFNDFTFASPAAGFHEIRFRALGKEVRFEEPCTVVLMLDDESGIFCEDIPHQTSIDIHLITDLDGQSEAYESIARDQSFSDRLDDGYRIIRWISDIDKMNALFAGTGAAHSQNRNDLEGVFSTAPTFYSALVCEASECLQISSASHTKIEGIISQILKSSQSNGT